MNFEKNFLRNNKGITLTGLAIYLIALTLTIALLSTVTAYYKYHVKKSNENAVTLTEYDKFNMYFLSDVKDSNNTIKTQTANIIEFSNGNTYEYLSNEKTVYLINNVNNPTLNIRLATNIHSFKFETYKEYEKTIIKVVMNIGDFNKSTEYVMDYENTYQ